MTRGVVIDNRVDVRTEGPSQRSIDCSTLPEITSEPSRTPTNQNTIYPQSENPQVNALRQILIDKPELQAKVKNAVGSHVDPLDEEVLFCSCEDTFNPTGSPSG